MDGIEVMDGIYGMDAINVIDGKIGLDFMEGMTRLDF